MKKFLMGAIGAFGVTYTAAQMAYGNAEYAQFGSVSVATDMIKEWAPGIMAIVYPVLTARWPRAVALIQLAMRLLQNQSGELAPMLDRVDAVEKVKALGVYAAANGDQQGVELCRQMQESLSPKVTVAPLLKGPLG